jgi:hypothetical protein
MKRSFYSLPFLLLAFACQQRTFKPAANSATRATKDSGADVVTKVASMEDEAILLNKNLPQDYTVGLNSTELDISKATKDLQVAHPELGGRVPKETILAVMRRNRKEFSPAIEEGVKNTAPILGIKFPFPVGTIGKNYFRLDSLDYDFSALHPDDVFEKGVYRSCGPSEANQWGDLQFHYYCQIPVVVRGCKTFFLIKLPQTDGKWGNSTHRYASTELCLDKNKALAEAGRTEAQLTADYADSKELIDIFGPNFDKFYRSQWVEMSTGAKVNLFDWLMNSSTFAFDYEAQQNLINEFYGDMKPKVDGAFDPTNEKDCLKYRPIRPKADEKTGKVCRVTEKKLQQFTAIGR